MVHVQLHSKRLAKSYSGLFNFNRTFVKHVLYSYFTYISNVPRSEQNLKTLNAIAISIQYRAIYKLNKPSYQNLSETCNNVRDRKQFRFFWDFFQITR